MWRGGPKWTSYASSWAPLAIISFTISTLPEKQGTILLGNANRVWLVVPWLIAAEGLPFMQASWSGEAVRAVRDGLTLAPYCKSSFAHSRLPEAQAWHRGVLPWIVRTSTWSNQGDDTHFIFFHAILTIIMTHMCSRLFEHFTCSYLNKSGFVPPGLQPPRATGHSLDEPVCRPRGAEWCCPPSPCWLMLHFLAAVSAAEPCHGKLLHAGQSGPPRNLIEAVTHGQLLTVS